MSVLIFTEYQSLLLNDCQDWSIPSHCAFLRKSHRYRRTGRGENKTADAIVKEIPSENMSTSANPSVS